jgi:L-malate glycosyltransferase
MLICILIPMKIGILLYPTFGGSGVVATELGKSLAQHGHEVHFITYSIPARLDKFHPHIFYHEVSVTSYPLFEYVPYETILASKIVEIAIAYHLDIIHAHYAIPHASAALLAKSILRDKNMTIPIVTTLHGTDITLVGKNPTYKPVVEYSINHSDAVTAVSESLKKDTLSQFDISIPIEVVPNFITSSSSNSLSHLRESIAPQGEKIITHTSNFRKVKRVTDVIHIFHMVRQSIPAKLVLIGDGPERSNVENLCRELMLVDDVTFLGKQDCVEDILQNGDIFVLPSETESFGLAALEAMNCSLPVVCSDTGGLPEVNIDGYSGFLLPVGDVQSMAEKVLYILSDPKIHQQFREHAKQRARSFSPESALEKYLNIYQSLLT